MQEKKLEKTMEAKDVTLLRSLIHLALEKLQKETDLDLILFVGTDGRIFDSIIPENLNAKEYYLLNIFKSNIHRICAQLKTKNMVISIEQYKEGFFIISQVGKSSFLASILIKEMNYEGIQKLLGSVMKWSMIVNHIFQLKPLSGEEVDKYPEDIKKEFHSLSRQLFVEKFEYTKEYRKNQKILEYLRKELSSVVGVGMVDEMLTLTFNEIGASPRYMKDELWPVFIERIVKKIRDMRGSIVADEYYKKWMGDVEKIMKSVV